jgi:hypothetical protein
VAAVLLASPFGVLSHIIDCHVKIRPSASGLN